MDSTIEKQIVGRVYWRLVPLLFVLMFFNYVDRVNVGFAALQMNEALGLTPVLLMQIGPREFRDSICSQIRNLQLRIESHAGCSLEPTLSSADCG
mgnify:CR=1 FL=1